MTLTQYYGFTIKCLTKQASRGSLEAVMHRMILKYKATYIEHVIEVDSKGRNHIHGTFTARKSLYCSLFKEKGYHIHIDALKTTEDVADWTKYIHDDDDMYKTWLNELRRGDYKFQDPPLTLDVSLDR